MALFVVNTPYYDGALKDTLMVAHQSHPLLATAWVNPTSVLITGSEGDILTQVREPAGGAGAANKTLSITSLAWHPVEPVLVIGWSNGKLSLWCMPPASTLGLGDDVVTNDAIRLITAKSATLTDAEGAVREHGASAVLAVEWSTHGMYLLSTSQQKATVAWMLDQTAGENGVAFNLKPLWSAEANAPVVRITHVPDNAPAPVRTKDTGARPHREVTGDDEINFLLADGSGTLWSINEDQKVSSCIRVDEPIVSYLYDMYTRTAITLSSSCMVEVHRISDELQGTSLLRRKLSTNTGPAVTKTNGEKVPISMAWAGDGVVAFGGGEDRLRIFDLKSEYMEVIALPSDGQRVSCLATFPQRGFIAAGTVDGVLIVFQHVSSSGPAAAETDANQPAQPRLSTASAESTSKWEALATHQVGQYVDRIVFTGPGDMAMCRGGKELQVLHETVRKRAWDGVAAATQISADMVVIESVTGCQCLLKSTDNVRGLSIAFPNIALWSGSKIDLYQINETTSEFTPLNFVPASSPAFAVHRDGLFYVKDNNIVYATMLLQPIAQLTFTESEGVPVILDTMNDYLVAVSSKNYLRLARISPRDLRQMGPSRPLVFSTRPSSGDPDEGSAEEGEEEGGPVSSVASPMAKSVSALTDVCISAARVNAQGRRVAFITKIGPVGIPDTRVWVYDSDTDKMTSFDFAPRFEVPEAVYWNTPEPNSNTIGELEYLLLACETRQTQAIEEKKDSPPDAVQAPKATPAAKPTLQQEDLPETLPDMENYAAKKDEIEEARRGNIGATNFIGNRAHNIVTLFATHSGLAVQNSASLRRYQICLVGLTIPDFLLASVKINGDSNNAEDYVIEQKRLRDFEGLKSDKDVAVREALMRFSYYSTIGNMDEAYRCIKTIKNPAAWQGLARMCVANGRLDVAAVCLATMEDCVAARALREAMEDYPDDKNVQLATLACGLGMMDECEALLRESKRFDLMTDVYLACGKFEHAQRHSERFDRIRIRPVAYKYAQFMESLQNMDAAVMWYYNAKCAGTDVPRIYFQTNRMHELRDLIVPRSNATSPTSGANESPSPNTSTGEGPQSTFAALFPQNKDLLLWWAQHSERRRNVQEALRFYHAGKDVYNVVRLLCSLNPPKIENAIEVVNTEVERAKSRFQQQQSLAGGPSRAGDADAGEPDPVGAAFFIGQLFERQKDMPRALEYYKHAGAYHSGVRVAWKSEQYNMVASLAAKSGDERLMLESAMQMEQGGHFDKAVELYRRIGAVQCALDTCVKGGLYEALHEISSNLASASTDPAIFLNMADHFQAEGNYQKAVEMLVFARRYDDALKMCEERNVTLTEDMAETMTGDLNQLSGEDKQTVLRKVAHVAKNQGSWSLACKKYTQAGDRIKAMKMLMRGGEVEKVIFFANHSRNTEIYTMAANFLQSQNWSNDSNIYKSIILFYTKAKAFGNLITFYESCAQLQIDENRNYVEALQAITECIQMAESGAAAKANVDKTKLEQLKERMDILRSFVKAQGIVDSINTEALGSPEEKQKSDSVISICSDLIKRSRPANPDHRIIQDALRVGDVFALLVRFYFDKLGESVNAMKVLESMPRHGAEPQLFIEMDYMDKICRANGTTVEHVLPSVGGDRASNTDRGTSAGTRRSSGVNDADDSS